MKSNANYLINRIIRVIFAALTLLSLNRYSPVRAAQSLPGLSVSGTQIVANGIPVRLRGVNMGDPFWARNSDWYPRLTLNDYTVLAQEWHANIVRIGVFPTQWKNTDHTQLIDGLSQQINAALSNGMYVIISYHTIGWPDGYYQAAYPGNPPDTYDSSMSVATSFWAAMSQQYGSDTRIIFDLWNEPVNPADLTSDPTDPNPLWPQLKSYYETLIQTVRNNHAQNIVIATGNRWASWLVGIKDNPLSDPNVVYAYHQYSTPGRNTASKWDQDTGGLIGVKPVIASEWGYEDSDAGASPQWPGTAANFGIPFTTWLEDNNLSNLAWIYHYDWTPAMLKSDGSPTLYGTFVKNYLTNQSLLASGAPNISNCSMFPSDNIWNTPIENLPVDSHSSAWINSVGAATGLHMDFGSGTWDGGPIGIPYNVTDSTTPKYNVRFQYSDESDPGPYPIPANPSIEYGSDHHLLVVDGSTCRLYEMWDTNHNGDGSWSAGSGAIWDLSSDALRPAGWTSADAAGLPILPGLLRYDEVAAGRINHAIRFTASSTSSYIWPARHLTSGTPGVPTSTPPMGARFRLKSSFDISSYPAQLQVILQAMKTYGIILADNGSNWYISGAPDPRWDNSMLHLLDNITGHGFEAIDESSLTISPDSGETSAGAPQITRLYPPDGSQACRVPQVGVSLYLSDLVRTAGGSFDPSKITLTLDGTDVTLAATIFQTMTQPASRATMLYTPPSDLALGPHQAALTYPSTAGSQTYTWSFTVASVLCTTSREERPAAGAPVKAPTVAATSIPEPNSSPSQAPHTAPTIRPRNSRNLWRPM